MRNSLAFYNQQQSVYTENRINFEQPKKSITKMIALCQQMYVTLELLHRVLYICLILYVLYFSVIQTPLHNG